MGIRSASARRPHRIMAPALTETATQTQNFKLAPKNFHLNTFDCHKNAKYEHDEAEEAEIDKTNRNDENDDDNDDELGDCKYAKKFSKSASENCRPNTMNNSSMDASMDEKMGKETVQIPRNQANSKSGPANDVEQLLNNFAISQTELPDELIQAITSTMEAAKNDDFPGDLASSLLSFEKQLLHDVDVDNMMNISMEDEQNQQEKLKEIRSSELIAEAQKKQVEVQRKLDFLRRRLMKLRVRLMSQHVSGEMVGVFEHVQKSLKRLKESSEKPQEFEPSNQPMTYGASKALVRKLENSKLLQANALARSKQVAKYFGAGSAEPAVAANNATVLPPWTPEKKHELQKVAGSLRCELRVVQSEIDSEATDSSSGGESCDEFQNYNNQHQQYLSIQKRALWKYSTDRAAIAARWTWLQVQISDLEYRIRQHTDLHRQVRAEKGAVTLEKPQPSTPTNAPSTTALNGYRGQLPGSTEANKEPSAQFQQQPATSSTDNVDADAGVDEGCARTRPLVGFRKRKLLQTGGLHVISKKAARPSTVRCGCDVPNVHCALCTGRVDPTHPRDPPEVLSVAEKVAMLDPGFHPVFSMADDVSESIHLEAIMKMTEWQQRSAKMKSLKSGYNNSKSSAGGDKTQLDGQNHVHHHHNHHRHHRSKNIDQQHRKKYGRLLKPSTISALSAKLKGKIRGRKAAAANRHLNRLNRKRLSSSNNIDGFDEEVESISGGTNNNNNVSRSAGGSSPSSSPLLQMQSISGYGRKNRVSSYDIDNIVIPYSVAASTRVEKLQYKEILTPKWRIADEIGTKSSSYDVKNNGTIRESDDENDNEDVSDEAILMRHEKCEQDERKKFLSYLKMPIGYGRARSHKRAESSDTNTPDPMSPHQVEEQTAGGVGSPQSVHEDGAMVAPLQSISALRRRTMSTRGGFPKDHKDFQSVPSGSNTNIGGSSGNDRCSTPDQYHHFHQEIQPYESRAFPMNDTVYEEMIKSIPEDLQQVRTNIQAQDTHSDLEMSGGTPGTYMDAKVDSPGSESTESALIDEDPNDPEWVDVERMSRERHKR